MSLKYWTTNLFSPKTYMKTCNKTYETGGLHASLIADGIVIMSKIYISPLEVNGNFAIDMNGARIWGKRRDEPERKYE